MNEDIVILHYGALGDTLCSWPVFLALDKAVTGSGKYFSGSGNLSFLLRPLGFKPCPPSLAHLERTFFEASSDQDYSEDTMSGSKNRPGTGRKCQNEVGPQYRIFRFCLDKAPDFIPRGATVLLSLPGNDTLEEKKCSKTEYETAKFTVAPIRSATPPVHLYEAARFAENPHVSEALAAQTVALGFDVPDMAEASARFQNIFGGWKGGESKKIALLPGAGHKMKQWPSQNFEMLAREFARAGYEPLQILGPVEMERGPDLRALISGLATAVPESLDALLTLLLEMRLVVGNDSGPMHLAALAGVPTLTIFGPTPPEVWRPLGPRARHIAPSIPCAPCNLKADVFGCAEPYCLESVTPNMVLNFIKQEGLLSSIKNIPNNARVVRAFC